MMLLIVARIIPLNVIASESEAAITETVAAEAAAETECPDRDASCFPDGKFYRAVLSLCDADASGTLSQAELDAVTSLDVSGQGIVSLTGIELFRNLIELDCGKNRLTALDLSENPGLTTLSCPQNQLTSLDISPCSDLMTLHCQDNRLETLDLSQNGKLAVLRCYANALTELDASGCQSLTALICNGNQLSRLTLPCPSLQTLQCHDNRLTSLDVSGCPELDFLVCSGNQLSCLDLSGNKKLTEVQALNNAADMPQLTENRILDLKTIPGFVPSRSSFWENASLKGDILTVDDTAQQVRFTYDIDGPRGDRAVVFTWIIPQRQGLTMETFPDENFRTIVTQQFDTIPDRVLTREEVRSVTRISAGSWRIASLRGIEVFSELTELSCPDNGLTSLDLSGNSKLETLDCRRNRIPYLDVSCCPNLKELDADGNVAAMEVRWDRTLDLATLPGFDPARAEGWGGASLDGSLLTINDDTSFVTFLYDVDGDNGTLQVEFAWEITFSPKPVGIPLDSFPDAAFRRCLAEKVDADGSGDLSPTELAVTALDVHGLGIGSLEGIDCFEALTDLDCSRNALTELDLSGNTSLETLNCGLNQLSSLTISESLIHLDCRENALTALDVRRCRKLETLSCGGNPFAVLDISGMDLKSLDCAFCESLLALKASNCPALREIQCSSCALTALDLANDPMLQDLTCAGNNLTALSLSKGLIRLDCSRNRLTALELAGLKELEQLRCRENRISSLDLSDLARLKGLDCRDNCLLWLDLSGNPLMEDLKAQGNTGTVRPSQDGTIRLSAIPGFDPTKMENLTGGNLDGMLLIPDEGSAQVSFTCRVDDHNTVDFTWTICGQEEKSVPIDQAHFPDEHFRRFLADTLDRDNDGLLSEGEAAVTELNVEGLEIASLDGISCFPQLLTLNCRNNRLQALPSDGLDQLTYLDCSQNVLTALDLPRRLEVLICTDNRLTDLDVGRCPELRQLSCGNNGLTELDVSRNNALAVLNCEDNALSRLDTRKCPLTTLICDNNPMDQLFLPEEKRLETLSCTRNQLDELDVSGCPDLTWLFVSGNELTVLDLTGDTSLEKLNLSDNRVTELDLTRCPELNMLLASGNRLGTLDLFGNPVLMELNVAGNPLAFLDLAACPAEMHVSAGGHRARITDCRLSAIPGFDPDRASGWTGGTLEGDVVKASEEVISFTYDLGGGFGTLDFTWEIYPEAVTEAIPEAAAPADVPHDVVCTSHRFSQWIPEIPATCVSEGMAAHNDCLICHKHFVRGFETDDIVLPIDPNYHAHIVSTPWVQASCTQDGYTSGTYCQDCGTYITGHRLIPAEHKFGAWVEEVSATSSTSGVKAHRDCIVCKKHFDADGSEIPDLVIPAIP